MKEPVPDIVEELRECEELEMADLKSFLKFFDAQPAMISYWDHADSTIALVSPRNSLHYNSKSMLQQASFPMW
jgi:hypothetical protein